MSFIIDCATFAPLFLTRSTDYGVTMALDASEIKKIAHLARLGINADDIPEYSRNLSDILAFVEQLNAVDTTGVEPLAHPLEATQRLRVDAVTETNNRDNFQQVAPETASGLYLVPQVIE
jgi:aspartyl-tRNA(Asn)/glutamyl-tRNA(Gln) amidotransferase subunit C